MVHVLEQEASREPGSPSRLSPEELVYAKEFADNMDTHLHSLALRHMPSNLQKMDRKKAGWCSCVYSLGPRPKPTPAIGYPLNRAKNWLSAMYYKINVPCILGIFRLHCGIWRLCSNLTRLQRIVQSRDCAAKVCNLMIDLKSEWYFQDHSVVCIIFWPFSCVMIWLVGSHFLRIAPCKTLKKISRCLSIHCSRSA